MKSRIIDYPSSSQLFSMVPTLRLYDYISLDNIKTVDGSNMPFLMWPDGTPCLLANSYMITLRMQPGRFGGGFSRLGSKGGSFGDYAGKISHLIRYCYYNNKNFISLTDNDFYNFIDALRHETKPNKPQQLKRTERTITSIGRRCLSFLTHVGEINLAHNFVGINGTISIELIESTGYRNGKAFKHSSVHHRSFRSANAKKRRRPIAQATIVKMRDAIDDMSTSEFLCNRRHLMISLFEETGARRGEIRSIMVGQVLTAAAMAKPTILLNTLKRGEGQTRELAISPALVSDMLNHVRTDRRITLKKVGISADHGFLFISERGGQPLQTDTFTVEFSLIRRHAKLEVQACAHLFRHLFCTNIVSRLISETQSLNPDSFRLTLLTDKTLAAEAMKQTGHTTLESLLSYVDTAFRQKSRFEQIVRNVEAAKSYETYERRRKHLLQQLKTKRISMESYIQEEETLTALMEKEFLNQ
ncbi:Phage integrase family protein [Pseudomonas reinekei]|uniref:Phage integrase family protein n=1 Tax=Pseudomonas reinekei TaxID=395598 RepID=A0A1H0INW0_PSERE|nr:site-specific integrase [Pseudomonas reinekei]KAB0486669.1 site-specific integrase [Pseudomonas reinekei]OLU04332.1 recombinase XerD [Pseudomonas reinekei]SDO33097.1 Phage integrase family protein [Pseudomonas reinekei]